MTLIELVDIESTLNAHTNAVKDISMKMSV